MCYNKYILCQTLDEYFQVFNTFVKFSVCIFCKDHKNIEKDVDFSKSKNCQLGLKKLLRTLRQGWEMSMNSLRI